MLGADTITTPHVGFFEMCFHGLLKIGFEKPHHATGTPSTILSHLSDK
jgi:hypothetical protein